MYKRYILQLLLFLCPLCGKAQDNTSIFPVDWKQIEQTVKTYPDSVKALVTRLTQPEIDTTMKTRGYSRLFRTVVYQQRKRNGRCHEDE